jgi:rSAM/selenodomain-associated transferase 1
MVFRRERIKPELGMNGHWCSSNKGDLLILTSMNVVALFLKVPLLGAVKTRLAKSLGDEGALMAYTNLVEFLLKRVGDSRIHIHHTAEDPERMISWLGQGYSYIAQEGSGLGERLIHAMVQEFAAGAEKLIFLGGDCPYVGQARLDQAFAALDDHDVVMGPAADGGYYLIGVKQNRTELFEGIDWGSETVCQTTLAICEEQQLSVVFLPEESDVDDLQAWQKAKAFMASQSSS